MRQPSIGCFYYIYIGKIALSGVLRKDLHEHFLLLNQAMCILESGNVDSLSANLCHRLLEKFVKDGSRLYGKAFLIFNVHSLLHLSTDAIAFKSLDYCSAFRFENYMRNFLKMVRTGKNSLSQVIRRYKESEMHMAAKIFHQSAELSRISVSAARPNNAFLMKDGSCCEVIQILNERRDYSEILCRVFASRCSLYTTLVNSCNIGAFKYNIYRICTTRATSKDLANRAILLEYPNGEVVFLTIVHSMWSE